ncbi:MAG TPA: serine hydrolase [Candidatus Acidoferrales bacterium]|nr:serine hydrolase [Candidatus Acidoferrales bacterium]
MRRKLAGAIFVLVLCIGAAGLARAQNENQWSSLDNYVESAMKQWKVPGMAVGIVQGDKAVYVKGYGVRDIKTGQPVTPDTLFDIGSCTKAFTAASVAILVDDGKIHWDDRVRDFVPFFHLYDPMADEYVTMRDLLTHRTGMQGTDLLWYGSPFSLEEIIKRVRYIKPDAGFRAKFQYQNVMYATAGFAAGESTGGTWQDFVRRRIFAPLGMAGPDFSSTDAQQAPDHATPHILNDDGSVVTMPWRNIDDVAPAGSINAGVRDMTKWIAMQLNDGAAEGKQIISKKNVEEMHTPQIVVPSGGEFQLFFPPALQLSYGMGWFIQDYRGHQILLHPGDIDGFASLVVLIPEVHTGFVILSNLDHNPVREGLGYHLIDQFLQLPEEDWIGRFAKIGEKFKAAGKKADAAWDGKQHANALPSRELSGYAGTYRDDAYGDATVTVEGDHLAFQYHSFQSAMTHYQCDTFVISLGEREGKTRVTFDLDADGNVNGLTTLGTEFKRVSDKTP